MLTLLVCLLPVLGGCDNAFAPAADSASLNKNAGTLLVTPSGVPLKTGGTQQLIVTDGNGNQVSVNWSSSNTAVATVSSSGLVTGVGAGAVTITAKNRNQSGTATFEVAAAIPAVQSAGLPRLKVAGKNITTETGHPVILRGVNIMRSEWDLGMSWERQAIPHLSAEWKGNVVVRGFAADPVANPEFSWTSGWGRTVTHETYMSWLDEYVSLGRANGVYIVFAFRSYGINGAQPELADGVSGKAARALAFLAARYKNESHVMFALQVEPHGSTAVWSTMRPMFEGMVDAIHAAAAPFKPIVMIPGTNWSRNISWAINDPVRRENVVYKTHPYNAQSAFDALFLDAYRAGLPVFIGEFGPFAGASMSDVNALLDLADANDLGWAAWNFDDGGGALLAAPRANFVPLDPYGVRVRDEMRRTSVVTR